MLPRCTGILSVDPSRDSGCLPDCHSAAPADFSTFYLRHTTKRHLKPCPVLSSTVIACSDSPFAMHDLITTSRSTAATAAPQFMSTLNPFSSSSPAAFPFNNVTFLSPQNSSHGFQIPRSNSSVTLHRIARPRDPQVFLFGHPSRAFLRQS